MWPLALSLAPPLRYVERAIEEWDFGRETAVSASDQGRLKKAEVER